MFEKKINGVMSDEEILDFFSDLINDVMIDVDASEEEIIDLIKRILSRIDYYEYSILCDVLEIFISDFYYEISKKDDDYDYDRVIDSVIVKYRDDLDSLRSEGLYYRTNNDIGFQPKKRKKKK